ncbi:DUF6077 domain-containing protein [Butyrivibrio hungatei]|uniref:DUF6077 domain-containing protein n=1 Tax=Butyrivibrio hungatei TaxID=185008 RepID=UPI002E8E4D25|nr:DUF6077 domain-containing protein [Butyrivibrio hungatei]
MVSLIFWLLIAPLMVGITFNFILPKEKRRLGITFVLGFLIYVAGFEIIAIPCMTKIMYNAFSYCVKYYVILAWALMIPGIIKTVLAIFKDKDLSKLFYIQKKDERINDTKNNGMNVASRSSVSSDELEIADPDVAKKHKIETCIYWGIFFALLAFQMVMAVLMASFDGDDAYYVVESLLAQQADVMNTILPYTGISTSLDIRHALAVITMWIAFIAKVSGVHATIVSHTVIPLIVIPLVYLVYVEIGKSLFRKKQEFVPVFMIIVSFLLMFGNVSIHTPATFFLMRTWQGKAIVCNLVFPLIFWIFLEMMEKKEDKTEETKEEKKEDKTDEKKEEKTDSAGVEHTTEKVVAKAGIRQKISTSSFGWIMLIFVNMLAGMCTAMGVIFATGLIGLLTLILLFIKKDWKVLIGAFICVIPNFVYLALYLSIWSR